MDSIENFYDILGISNKSDQDGIKRAFRTLAKRTHPDVEGGERSKYDKIREAYDFLSQENLRKEYDQEISRKLAQSQEKAERSRLQGLDTITKIEIILAWSTERKTFNPSFANSCLNQLAEGRELSEKQINSLENIILRFKIDLDRWFDDEERETHLSKYFEETISGI